MQTILLSDFKKYPVEAEIIGRLLAGYGEIEFEFCQCLEVALGESGLGLKALFRIRSEGQRIEVADALMRDRYKNIGLAGGYGNAIGATKSSKNIRNQYAHCHWWATESDGLFFYDLEKGAEIKSGEITIRFCHVDVTLLQQQEEYFCYTLDWLIFLKNEYQRLAGKISSHSWRAPKVIRKPDSYNPQDEHPFTDLPSNIK